ncbi:hypothetical protein HMPREF1546_02105 [Oscillibacter sp. KLE 1745]|nr:hypothetical protein HMPREF1546_02105 [Oscillibacter sp. KLE 1745]
MLIGKSNSTSKEQRGRVTGCKRACGGSCERAPGSAGDVEALRLASVNGPP